MVRNKISINFVQEEKHKMPITIDTTIFVTVYKNKFPKNTMVRDYSNYLIMSKNCNKNIFVYKQKNRYKH